MFTENTYQEDIKHFNKVRSTEAYQLLSTEDLAVVYIGRGTCPYCRKFAKKLSNLVSEIPTTIYYVDSSEASDTEVGLFRERYDIVTVPGFIVSKNGKLTIRCDSSMPENEILGLIK